MLNLRFKMYIRNKVNSIHCRNIVCHLKKDENFNPWKIENLMKTPTPYCYFKFLACEFFEESKKLIQFSLSDIIFLRDSCSKEEISTYHHLYRVPDTITKIPEDEESFLKLEEGFLSELGSRHEVVEYAWLNYLVLNNIDYSHRFIAMLKYAHKYNIERKYDTESRFVQFNHVIKNCKMYLMELNEISVTSFEKLGIMNNKIRSPGYVPFHIPPFYSVVPGNKQYEYLIFAVLPESHILNQFLQSAQDGNSVQLWDYFGES